MNQLPKPVSLKRNEQQISKSHGTVPLKNSNTCVKLFLQLFSGLECIFSLLSKTHDSRVSHISDAAYLISNFFSSLPFSWISQLLQLMFASVIISGADNQRRHPPLAQAPKKFLIFPVSVTVKNFWGHACAKLKSYISKWNFEIGFL